MTETRLDKATFLDIVRHTPLVSIDLIVSRSNGHVLLGRRLNQPARGYWFVPGGRIYKDETLASAYARISRDELGTEYTLEDAQFKGCYEHFYSENFAEEPGISTHYVVLAYQLELNTDLDTLPTAQHDDYRWFDREGLLNNLDVHNNTRDYFI